MKRADCYTAKEISALIKRNYTAVFVYVKKGLLPEPIQRLCDLDKDLTQLTGSKILLWEKQAINESLPKVIEYQKKYNNRGGKGGKAKKINVVHFNPTRPPETPAQEAARLAFHVN